MIHEVSLSPCLHCGDRCATNGSLCDHVNFVHESAILDCLICGDEDNNFRHVKRHMAIAHSNLTSSFQQCEQWILVNHISEQHNEYAHEEIILKCQ